MNILSRLAAILRTDRSIQRERALILGSGFFEEDWYRSRNTDVDWSSTDPLTHFLRFGDRPGCDPGPGFSTSWYLSQNSDVKAAGMIPLVHYLVAGRAEGRRPLPESPLFDDSAFRVFCISFQRTGTTSVGKFFRDFGFQWAGWPADEKNDWSLAWYEGRLESIFSSADFRSANAFEDSPWFLPGFYRILFQRFPNSKFILFERDPDAWFRSMLSHSGSRLIGTPKIHAKIYRREPEYYDLIRTGAIDADNRPISGEPMMIAGHADHYKEVYRLHGIEVREFFNTHAPQALFTGQLEDPDKWRQLGAFLGFSVPEGYESLENRSMTVPA